MNIYLNEYRQKLTTPQKAVEKLKDGDTIGHGLTPGSFMERAL
ncbi:MAG: hypothetical protein Q7J27_01630 [Syntrophales bacterium]|nr:hypothetical protein [Syntrophales bacterium]